ncbi:MAG: thioesterase [Confluentimicrobium sp.]|jgi:4-hydroxybenzoyl-CoA thioesterase|nr:thioesterase [Actibacterium sp.]MAQ45520.1 thioesterase [Actibacterium sp.]MAQ45545.1 thioesterase [Actibacterium sp.]|tara:strand:- start:95 stop:511 length:417 start_codon:yes stop_codon:yes gene_type:complete
MFERTELIRFQHCDPAGIVFYPRYVEMINATVEDWFAETIGISFHAIHVELNVAIPAVALEVGFTAPSRIGEVLTFMLEVERLGASSVTLNISANHNGLARLASKLTLVMISKEDYRPRAWPEDFRSRITGREISQGA